MLKKFVSKIVDSCFHNLASNQRTNAERLVSEIMEHKQNYNLIEWLNPECNYLSSDRKILIKRKYQATPQIGDFLSSDNIFYCNGEYIESDEIEKYCVLPS